MRLACGTFHANGGTPSLQSQGDDGAACAADVVRFAAKMEGADGRLAAEPFVDARAETARAEAVDDADFIDARHDAAVDEWLQLLQRVFDTQSYQIDFVGCIAFDDWRDDFHDSRFRRFVFFRRFLEVGGFHREIDAIHADDDRLLIKMNNGLRGVDVEAHGGLSCSGWNHRWQVILKMFGRPLA